MLRKTVSLLVVLAISLNLFFVGACKKPAQQLDESAAAYKKRLAGIYLGKAAVSLRAVSDATEVLTKAAKLSKESATIIYNTDDKAADVLSVIADRVKNGFTDNDTIVKLDAILADVQKIEQLGVVNLTDTARNQFVIITGGVRASLATLRAILLSQSQPNLTRQALAAQREINRARIAASNPQWVFDLIQVVLIAYGDAEALNNNLTVDAAFGAVSGLIEAVKTLNNTRRGELA